MTRRVLLLLLWVCLGHAAAGALYVGLVNVSDANAGLLALSALTALAALVVLGVTDATGLLWTRPHVPFSLALRRAALRGLPALLLGGAVFGLALLLANRIDAWHAAHAGELDAWLMSAFGATRTAWVHRALRLASFLVRAVLGVSLFLAAFAAVVSGGWRAAISMRWLRTTVSRRLNGAVALTIVLLVALPWRAVEWRPEGLPPNAVEAAFVATKLTLLYVVAHVGWLLMLFVAGELAAEQGSERRRRL